MTPIERAAREVFDRRFGAHRWMPDEGGPVLVQTLKYDAAEQWKRDECLRDARAVLSAIRNFPNFNDPVTKAGSAVLSVGANPHWSRDHEAQKVWQAMIDATLAEGQPA